MKRRFFIVLLALITVFAFTACGETDSQGSGSASNKSSSKKETVYHVGDTWTVDGLWEFTINSVTSTEERNEYYEGEEPAEVISINYTYKNLGYEDEYQDLWIYLESVMDCEGNMCREYYLSADQSPQETPIGGICNAVESFGLKAAGNPVTLYIRVTDMDGNTQKATFELEY